MTACSSRITNDRRQGATALLLVLVIMAGCAALAAAQDVPRDPPPARRGFWGRASAPSDTTGAFDNSLWGPVPTLHDSVSGEFKNRPRPGWETAVLVPYWVIGVPFWLVYQGIDQAVIGADKLGIVGFIADYPGLKVPGDAYLMPIISIGDVEGFTLGLELTRHDFLGEDNMLFIQGSRSTRKADELSGGTLFQLGKNYTLQVGGGTEEKNLVRYYGLGPESIDGDLSYYHRITSWGGFEIEKDLFEKSVLELRSYFSKVQAIEPRYEMHQSVNEVHGDDIPYGYPGESSGWTNRLGLFRDNTDQSGRPGSGGFQSVGASLFTATDGSDLNYLTYHANIERYYSLWHTDRTLALRGFFNRISNIGSSEVPFTRLVTFQRPDELRGFSSLRFYGLGSLGFTIEYRWPIWVAHVRDSMGVDAYIFSDIGQVFDKTADISMQHMRGTGGVGLRFVNSERGFGARFELGFSDEQTVVRLTFSQTFQYNPKGMLHGKNPTRFY